MIIFVTICLKTTLHIFSVVKETYSFELIEMTWWKKNFTEMTWIKKHKVACVCIHFIIHPLLINYEYHMLFSMHFIENGDQKQTHKKLIVI